MSLVIERTPADFVSKIFQKSVYHRSTRKQKIMRALSIGLGVLALIVSTGCSSFHKEWKAATKAPVPANSIDGPWTGEWRSERNGHHGKLRCVMTKTSDTTYRAHFRANFFKICRFTYAATLTGRETNGVVALQGEANLGKLAGGVYKYEGRVTPTEFQSTYASKHDHGNYQMSRPVPSR
jgi:hypothetical protein